MLGPALGKIYRLEGNQFIEAQLYPECDALPLSYFQLLGEIGSLRHICTQMDRWTPLDTLGQLLKKTLHPIKQVKPSKSLSRP